jgi:hypothetical protein
VNDVRVSKIPGRAHGEDSNSSRNEMNVPLRAGNTSPRITGKIHIN